MTETSFSYQGRTCGECAYLTEKAPIHISGEFEKKEKGLCRLLILERTFAVMLVDEVACPEFVPKKG